MPQQIISSVENNFTAGLKTEFTGLNFPENAATDCDNCLFTIIGDILRREGIDFEPNYVTTRVNRSDKAITTYKWNNAGGDGESQIEVVQVGNIIYYFLITAATDDSPLSAQLLSSVTDINSFIPSGATSDVSEVECQFSTGNGYLFGFNPASEPFYVKYANNTLTAAIISVQIRDFLGISESGIADTTRPSTLNVEHQYNLQNQGWLSGGPWTTSSTTSNYMQTGLHTFTVDAGLPAVVGQHVSIYYSGPQPPWFTGVAMSGTLTDYTDKQMTIFVNSVDNTHQNITYSNWTLTPSVNGYIDTWNNQIGNYPSNSDVWWRFKDQNNVFNPVTTLNNVTLSTPAPKGHYILSAFSQDRSLTSAISGITPVVTSKRPRTGTWFQGRVWYAGVDGSQDATEDAGYYTWTENLYFSQISSDATDFGKCYQVNDPTNEDLFDLLPTDGGVITIQGCGAIYKLFPVQNGMLVFAANGVWFITGSQGIGFTANDYTITKISSVECISGSSFVDVLGLPYFWNEEGIYQVQVSQSGSIQINPITVGTILSFYNDIPLNSKRYAKGAYDPINYVIQWVYKSTEETSITDRYSFDRILNYNTYNKAFFPYSVDNSGASINGITYIQGPGGSNTPDAKIKYVSSFFNLLGDGKDAYMTFADEHDTAYVDWASTIPVDFVSYFITGYKLHGQGQRRFQLGYIYVYSDAEVPTQYKFQGIWDYANDPNSGKYTSIQLITNALTRFSKIFRRHKVRGRGLVLQFKISSSTGMPFHINGWSVQEQQNTGV